MTTAVFWKTKYLLSRVSASGDVLSAGVVYNLSTGSVELIEETITSLHRFSENK